MQLHERSIPSARNYMSFSCEDGIFASTYLCWRVRSEQSLKGTGGFSLGTGSSITLSGWPMLPFNVYKNG